MVSRAKTCSAVELPTTPAAALQSLHDKREKRDLWAYLASLIRTETGEYIPVEHLLWTIVKGQVAVKPADRKSSQPLLARNDRVAFE